jgi:hypothetical protein
MLSHLSERKIGKALLLGGSEDAGVGVYSFAIRPATVPEMKGQTNRLTVIHKRRGVYYD